MNKIVFITDGNRQRREKCYEVGGANWRKFEVVNHQVGSWGRASGRGHGNEVPISKGLMKLHFFVVIPGSNKILRNYLLPHLVVLTF